jgi:hypothetical protein
MLSQKCNPEPAMPDPSPSAIAKEPVSGEAQAQLAKASVDGLQFLFAAQKLFVGELVFAANEAMDRARTETHLFSEFISKLAGSHSVRDLRTMYAECTRHQLDFVRRDCERLFKHGDSMIEATSRLLDRSKQT